MNALTARKAASVLESDIGAFEALGFRAVERPAPLAARLGAPPGGRDVVLRLAREGRFFGGNLGLEVSTAEPVLPATRRGLGARGRGVVKLRGVRFRARGRGDDAAARLARALSEDEALGTALGRVHFDLVSVRPDGRPAIRHLGGSVVWVLFPPIVRSTPLPAQQARELVRALDAFAAAGARV